MKNALIVYGGWDGHHPKYGADLFGSLLEQAGYNVELSDSLDSYTDPILMQRQDLIVNNWTMGKISDAQMKGLNDAIVSGCGLAGWHGGMCDAFRENTWYQFMTGGQWVAHPGNIMDYTVNILPKPHEITAGLSDFKVHTEQYFLHVDPGLDVWATTTFDGVHSPETKGTVMPVVWTKRWGLGKVFYCALGHKPDDFDVPECRELIRRGLLWASR